VLVAARDAPDPEVEMLTLDALARLHAENGRTSDARVALDAADACLPMAGHLVADGDRVDAGVARALLPAV
jgi:hypothetical protein